MVQLQLCQQEEQHLTLTHGLQDQGHQLKLQVKRQLHCQIDQLEHIQFA